MIIDDYVVNSEWRITNTSAQKNVIKYPCCQHPYADLVFEINLSRKVTFHLRLILIPTVLLSVMSVAVFWIPPHRPDRTSIGRWNCNGRIITTRIHLGGICSLQIVQCILKCLRPKARACLSCTPNQIIFIKKMDWLQLMPLFCSHLNTMRMLNCWYMIIMTGSVLSTTKMKRSVLWLNKPLMCVMLR